MRMVTTVASAIVTTVVTAAAAAAAAAAASAAVDTLAGFPVATDACDWAGYVLSTAVFGNTSPVPLVSSRLGGRDVDSTLALLANDTSASHTHTSRNRIMTSQSGFNLFVLFLRLVLLNKRIRAAYGD